MKTRVGLMLAIVGGAATIAAAQPQTQGSVTWNLQYFVATQGATGWASATVAAAPGGVVGAGQAALFRLSFDLSGTPGGLDPITEMPLGTPLTYSSTIIPGSAGAGGLGGLWNGNVNVTGSGGDVAGTWSDNTAAYSAATRRRLISPYADGGGSGLPTPTGSAVQNIQPAQFGANAATLDHGDGVTVWTGLWIPSSYAARTVTFTPGLGSLGFLSQVYAVDNNYSAGQTLPVALSVLTNFGSGVGVQIVPAPSSLALLGLGGLVAFRRRRA
jgi:hypothetical protein